MNDEKIILDVKNLTVQFKTPHGIVKAVNDISFDLKKGETLGILGESGSGKTVTIGAITGLLETPPAEIIGILQFLTKRGIKSSGDIGPRCPPALLFTAIIPSAPKDSTFFAYFKSTTSHKTLIPFGLQELITEDGLPKEVII